MTERSLCSAGLSKLIELQTLPAILADKDGVISCANAAARKLCGRKLAGARLQNIVTLENGEAFPAPEELVRQHKGESLQAFTIRHPVESNRVISLKAELLEEGGTFPGVLLRLTDGLQDSDSPVDIEVKKEQLFGQLAHDISSPLSALNSGMNLLKHADEEERDWTLDMMGRQMLMLRDLVSSFLDLSRVLRGKLTFQEDVYDLKEVLLEAVEAARERTLETEIDLRVETTGGKLLVYGDQHRSEQILTQLLLAVMRNADDSAPVQVSGEKRNGEAVISIGEAIAPMDPTEESSGSAEGGGEFVGLLLAEKLCLMQGGSLIRARGRAAGEPAFEVRFPLNKTGSGERKA